MRIIVNFSGGVCSALAAYRAVETYGADAVTLLFADTLEEDIDLYRFRDQVVTDLGVPLAVVCDGRNPWDVFFDERFLGNSRIDPCSKILKRQLLDKWHTENCDPADTLICIGLAWHEYHRLPRFQARIAPWLAISPMCDPPYLGKEDMWSFLRERGIEPPDLSLEGFPHNNCGGFCIKSGQAQFKHLLRVRPATYAKHEQKEQDFIEFIGKPVSILKDRRNGKTVPLTLREFRIRVEAGEKTDEFDWGGCGCAIS